MTQTAKREMEPWIGSISGKIPYENTDRENIEEIIQFAIIYMSCFRLGNDDAVRMIQ